jgi:hypothetical protein
VSLITVIDHLVDDTRKEVDPDLSSDEFFEMFVSELVTRDFAFDWEDIESGIVDGENDGQIDAIYVLLDEQLIREKKDVDLKTVRRNAVIRVIIQQSKNKGSFEENVLTKYRSSLQDLFELENDIKDLSKIFNSSVITQVDLFRHLFLGLQGKNPSVVFDIYYASKGDIKKANARIQNDAEAVADYLKKQFFNCEATVKLLGARELVDLANRPRFITKNLEFTSSPTSDASSAGWTGLVRLDEYYKFITDNADKSLLVSIFEENVRDFEGDVEVNKEISESLNAKGDGIDFWWLNNGITLLCDEARPHTNKVLVIDKPLIVNGLQTSNKIWQYFLEQHEVNDERHVLVRVIQATDESTRDKIIRATNRQTPIGSSQLKATERIHRDIEAYFRTRSKYYERRKNSYKNAGKPKRDIFSINEVAQAIIAIVLARPDDARARPGSLLKSEGDYNKVFDPNAPLEL